MEHCEQYTALISAAVDGELTEAEHRELMDHLAKCPACREVYAQMSAMHLAFAELDDIPLPGDLTGDVMAKVRAQGQIKRPRHYWWQVGAAAACCALVFFGYRYLQAGALPAGPADQSAPYAVSAGSQEADGSQDLSGDAAPQGDGAAVGADTTAAPPASPESNCRNTEESAGPTAGQETVEDVRTSFDSGEPKVSTALMEGGEDTQLDACLTLSSSAPELKDWLEEHLPEGGVSTASADGEARLLITVAEYEELTAYLAEQDAPYDLEGGELLPDGTSVPAADAEMVCVVYLDSAASAP